MKLLFRIMIFMLFLFLLLSVWNYSKAYKDYYRGEAVLKTFGYPSYTIANLNREYRVYHHPIGCGPNFGAARYNEMLLFLHEKRGFQKNAYLGYYPTDEEVFEIFTDSTIIDSVFISFVDDRINFESNKLNLSLSLEDQHGYVQKTVNTNKENRKIGFYKQDSCVVLALNSAYYYLLDMKRMKIFAQYRIKS